MRYFFTFLFLFSALVLVGNPKVPGKMQFADIQLTITDAARRDIQKDVDALHRNQTYLKRKIDKIDLFFPIIERVFREEGLPDDFKYLVVQESALVSDAVSSSNAIGFWQFKEASALEVGLRVDRNIDERMHITASSHAAARYLKKNNFFFDNWIYALLAYNTGPGGAEQHINQKYLGKKKMEINKHTHWYVKKFLAHKVAFEQEIGKNYDPLLRLYEYDDTPNKSLKEIANYFEIDQQSIEEYNKWLRRGRIPSDKSYVAIIPVAKHNLVAQNLLNPSLPVLASDKPKAKISFQSLYQPIEDFDFAQNEQFPKVTKSLGTKMEINGIPGFIALPTDDINTISMGHGISVKNFLKYNEMTSADKIIPGQVYYLKAKKSKAKIHYHVVTPGESAWSISQKYGIKVKKFLSKNRMREEKELSSGMVVWLRFIRPADVPVEYRKPDAQNVIVKSIPNQIDYPDRTYPPIEEDPETTPLSEIFIDATPKEDDEGEFLFEQVDEDTEYISENSYINVEEEKRPIPENTPAEIPEQIVEKEKIYHIVKDGETLFSISRLYDVSIGEIRQWNEFDNLDVIHIDQRIVILSDSIPEVNEPQQIKSPDQYLTYKVKADDTLYGIAREHNISIKELMDINKKTDFIVKQGELIKIKVNK